MDLSFLFSEKVECIKRFMFIVLKQYECTLCTEFIFNFAEFKYQSAHC